MVYHDVSSADELSHSKHYSTEITLFQKHIEFFQKNFSIVSLDELAKSKGWGNRLAITFDDGFKSIKKNAIPLLREKNIPFTIFLNSSAVEGDSLWITEFILHKNELNYFRELYKEIGINVPEEQFLQDPVYMCVNNLHDRDKLIAFVKRHSRENCFLDREDVIKLRDKKVDFGAHSMHHFNIASLTNHELKIQIKEDKQKLEKILGFEISKFAIPFGKMEHYNKNSIQYCAEVGYEQIYHTNPNDVHKKDFIDGIELIPRIVLTNESLDEISFYINRTLLKKYKI
ncbi:MAG: polysaccharide deacetylase family protein [Bacteroidetes bacterium]|nr:polysaccharide deacetylase family protein [Bacteroidota bacterium]